jgi:GR25 family glycosyltransferase involved in LPS biosynthesis
MISLNPTSKNVNTFNEWCTQQTRTGEVIPGRRVTSLEEAKPFLTSYGWYIMHNWRESSCHFDTTGPIGCFLAHRDVWKVCVSRNENIWVFEEGVYSYTTHLFDEIDTLYPTKDLIMGHTIHVPRMWRQKSMNKSNICSVLASIDKIYFGTKCYRLSPAFAARLLENSVKFDTHVDTFICTEAIRYADEFSAAHTRMNIVSAFTSGTINHSIDHSLFILISLLIGIITGSGVMIYILNMYRICRTRCPVSSTIEC